MSVELLLKRTRPYPTLIHLQPLPPRFDRAERAVRGAELLHRQRGCPGALRAVDRPVLQHARVLADRHERRLFEVITAAFWDLSCLQRNRPYRWSNFLTPAREKEEAGITVGG